MSILLTHQYNDSVNTINLIINNLKIENVQYNFNKMIIFFKYIGYTYRHRNSNRNKKCLMTILSNYYQRFVMVIIIANTGII